MPGCFGYTFDSNPAQLSLFLSDGAVRIVINGLGDGSAASTSGGLPQILQPPRGRQRRHHQTISDSSPIFNTRTAGRATITHKQHSRISTTARRGSAAITNNGTFLSSQPAPPPTPLSPNNSGSVYSSTTQHGARQPHHQPSGAAPFIYIGQGRTGPNNDHKVVPAHDRMCRQLIFTVRNLTVGGNNSDGRSPASLQDGGIHGGPGGS